MVVRCLAWQDQNYGHKALRAIALLLNQRVPACKLPPPAYSLLSVVRQNVRRHIDEKKAALLTSTPSNLLPATFLVDDMMVLYFSANFIDRGSVPIKRGGD